jgi:hypothetical protein
MEIADENTSEVLDHQLNGLPVGKGAGTVFNFATPLDLAIIAVSCFAAIVAGGLNPLLSASHPFIFSSCQRNNNNGTGFVWSTCRVIRRLSKWYSLRCDP